MKANPNILISKASGELLPFNKEKLKRSLLRAGAHAHEADKIVNEVTKLLYEGMSTHKIYKVAFGMLRNVSRSVAARYKLKQAILELGPSGFPFEVYISEILRHRGYKTQVGIIVQGNCVKHEIDVIAEKDDHHYMIECKFHNRQGYITDVKTPLYIQSRFLDVEKSWKQIDGHGDKFHQGWLVTNTRFSDDASTYGNCIGLHLVGWDYPKNGGLKDMIDSSGLHPVTCLTTLTFKEKQSLLDRKIVLCKSLQDNESILSHIGVKPNRIRLVMTECEELRDSLPKIQHGKH